MSRSRRHHGQRPGTRDRSLDALCRGARWKSCWPNAEALDRFRRTSDNLYERVRALFFLYAIHRFHIPRCGRRRRDARADSLRGLRQPAEAALRRGHRHFPGGAGRPRAERRHLQRAGRRLSRARIPDAGRPGAPQRALRARQPVDVPHRAPGRLPAAHPPRAAAEAPAAVPRPARSHAGAHGPDAQRMERHLLPGNGFSGRRAGAQHFDRPGVRGAAGQATPRQAAGGSLFPRDRSAGAAPGQRGSASQRRTSVASPRSSISRAIIWGC